MFKKLNTMDIFLEDPIKEVNVREFARIKKIAPATASKELEILYKENLLKKNIFKGLNLYSANTESEAYKDLKVYKTIRKLKESGLIDAINKHYLKPTIIFFGSASRGEDNKQSDIDLLIISERKSELSDKDKYEKKFKKEIQLIVVTDIKEIKNEHLINNILNGITIQGTVKWI